MLRDTFARPSLLVYNARHSQLLSLQNLHLRSTPIPLNRSFAQSANDPQIRSPQLQPMT